MSDVAVAHGNEILHLLPNDIQVSDLYNVRPFAGDPETEDKRIEELANTIDAIGQMDAGIVVATANSKSGQFVLIAGHRRRRAILALNEKRTAQNKPLIRMRVVVDRTGGDNLRKAILNNVQRENESPMDIAMLCQRLRESYNYPAGLPGAKKVAAYMGVSVTTVTQHERFLGANKDLQNNLHSGNISAQSAFELMAVKPEKVKQVIARATEIQADQFEQEKFTAETNGKKKPEAKKTIERPALVEAIRELADAEPGAVAKAPTRTRKEIIEFFTQFDSPAYGFTNGAVRQFIAYFESKWVGGEGRDGTMKKLFEAVIANAPEGTESKKDIEANKAEDAKAEVEAAKKAKKTAKTAKKASKKAPKK